MTTEPKIYEVTIDDKNGQSVEYVRTTSIFDAFLHALHGKRRDGWFITKTTQQMVWKTVGSPRITINIKETMEVPA